MGIHGSGECGGGSSSFDNKYQVVVLHIMGAVKFSEFSDNKIENIEWAIILYYMH